MAVLIDVTPYHMHFLRKVTRDHGGAGQQDRQLIRGGAGMNRSEMWSNSSAHT